MNKILHYFKLNGKEIPLWRANLNARSTDSDGVLTPPQLVALYGCDGAMSITDFNHPFTPSEYPPAYLAWNSVIPGITWRVPGICAGQYIDLLAYGIPENLTEVPATLADASELVKSFNGLLYIAHPHLSGLNARMLMKLLEHSEINGIEICNSAARKNGKAYSFNLWDNLLDAGYLTCFGIATDGFKHPQDFLRAAVMIAAEDNKPATLMEALRQGHFFATQGPLFKNIEYSNRHFHAEFDSAVEVVLIGNTPHVPEHFNGFPYRMEGYPWPGCNPKQSLLENGTEFIDRATTVDSDLPGWGDDGYIRCQIRDANGNYAWSQPFKL